MTTLPTCRGKYWRGVAASGMIQPANYIKVSALFIDSINSLMPHRIFTDVEETNEQDVEGLMVLYINGLKKHKNDWSGRYKYGL